jgi:hypothetical protein
MSDVGDITGMVGGGAGGSPSRSSARRIEM